MSYERPYAGLKVVDISQGVAGPGCGMLLALHGAEVVKVEPPEGDWIRGLGTRFGEHTACAIAVNRGKKSIAVDLKAAEGQAIVRRLAAECDIFIESFRPGVAARLNLGYEALRPLNPRMLYLSVSGFGQSGPYAARACTDTVAQAFSGLMSVNRGEDGVPHKVGFIMVDAVTASYAFQAVATALFARQGAAEGRHIDVSLMQSAAAIMATKVIEAHLEEGPPKLLNSPAGSYRTRDGWIALTLVKEQQFHRMCEALQRPDLPKDPRFADFASRGVHHAELAAILREVLAQRGTADWLERFAARDVLCNPINDFDAWTQDPHVQEVRSAPLVPQPGVGLVPAPTIPGLPPAQADDPTHIAPDLGEHGRDILRRLGYAESDIDRHAAAGVIRLTTPEGED